MYCLRPFTHFYLTENGDVHLCCKKWINRNAGNILTAPPMDIWNGLRAKTIRDSIIDRSFRFCTNCPLLPGPRGPIKEGNLPPVQLDQIETLILAYDPTCNLKCPSCRTRTKWADRTTTSIHDKIISSGILGHVKELCMSGSGDPIASPLLWSLLCELPRLGCRPDLSISLQTNGLLLTPERWEKMGVIREKVKLLSVSIDASNEKTYKINRNGDWDLLMSNLDWITERLDPPPALLFNFVVQANNFTEMPGFVELANRYKTLGIYFSALVNWGTYSAPDYRSRAVHLPSHPLHPQLLEILENPILHDEPRITLAGMPNIGEYALHNTGATAVPSATQM